MKVSRKDFNGVDLERLNVEITPELKKKLKTQAIQDNFSLREIVNLLVEAYLENDFSIVSLEVTGRRQ